MINNIFDWCVNLLVVMARWLGTSYQAINVWVFVIIWPLLTIALSGIIFWQWRKIRRLSSR